MKKIIFRGVIVIIALSIGGKILMDRREKDNEELRTIWQIICIIIMRFLEKILNNQKN